MDNLGQWLSSLNTVWAMHWLIWHTPIPTSDFKKGRFKGIASCWSQARNGVTVVGVSQLPERQHVSLSTQVLSWAPSDQPARRGPEKSSAFASTLFCMRRLHSHGRPNRKPTLALTGGEANGTVCCVSCLRPGSKKIAFILRSLMSRKLSLNYPGVGEVRPGFFLLPGQ